VSDRPIPPLSRRAALRLAALAPFASLAPLTLLAACREVPDPPPGTAVELAALPEGVRVRILVGEEPVEVVRRGGAATARSLWCTHLGCEVRWNETTATYDCPCHEGRFDAEGRVLAGPPNAPLRALEVRVVGDRIVLPGRRAPAGDDKGA
jgi:Rieske Fe-S protein